MTSNLSMEEANRQDMKREAALGAVLTAIHAVKQLYAANCVPDTITRAQALIEQERNFLQAVWD